MIAPATLAQLVAATRIDATRAAIVATLAALLKGVTVVGHPGKLDVNDVVAKAVVASPGVAVGYSRIRALGDPGGTFSAAVDYVAYIVAEDWIDQDRTPPVRVLREVVGHAIGSQILRILREPDAASWGLAAIEPPLMDPAPELRPVFTMNSDQNMTALYAVTWSQSLVQEGQPFFGGPTPDVDTAGLSPRAAPFEGFIDFDVDDDGPLPPEILAHLRGDDAS